MGLDRSNFAAAALSALALIAGSVVLAAHWAASIRWAQSSIDVAGVPEKTVAAEYADPLPRLAVPTAGAAECVQPVRSLRASQAVDWPSIVRAPLGGLARTLENPAGSRPNWDYEVQAVASSLGAGASPYLLSVVENTSRGLTERVAAAEMLRVLDACAEVGGDPAEGGVRFGDEALQALRLAGSTVQPFPLRCAAACRSLAGLGTAEDLAALLQALSSIDDPALRDIARWGLQSASGEQVALELATLACSSADPAASESAVIALEGSLRSRQCGELSPAVRGELEHRVGALVVSADSPPILRLRAIPVLCGLGGESARTTLQSLLRDPNTSASLAGAAANALLELSGNRALADPAQLFADGAALCAHPLEMTEAILRTTRRDKLDDGLRMKARACLRAIAEQPRSNKERGRAVMLLARLGDTSDLE